MSQFKNILFVVEDAINLNTFDHAIRLATNQQAKLTFIDAIEKPPMWAMSAIKQKEWDQRFADMLANREAVIRGSVKPHMKDLDISINVLEGKIYLETIRAVLRDGHDLVIKHADNSNGIVSRIFGSHDMRILRHCPCPVLITHPNWDGKFKHTLAPIDFEDANDIDTDNTGNLLNKQILETAIGLSTRENSNLDVAHVFPVLGVGSPPDGRYGLQGVETESYIKKWKPRYEQLLDQLLVKVEKWVGRDVFQALTIKPHVLWGNPNIEIPKHAKRLQSDLVVMGTVARTGVSGFLIGNTAEIILENIECSVLALKPEGFVTPVKLDE